MLNYEAIFIFQGHQNVEKLPADEQQVFDRGENDEPLPPRVSLPHAFRGHRGLQPQVRLRPRCAQQWGRGWTHF